MNEMQQVDIAAYPYKFIYEATDEVVGIESTLINLGLVVQSKEINLSQIKQHFDKARELGLARVPTLLMSVDTQAMNNLDYYHGLVALSVTKNNHPLIGINIGRYIQQRTRIEGEWIEGWNNREIQMTLCLNDNSPYVLEVSGADFGPSDLTDGQLMNFVDTIAHELMELSKSLPVWDAKESLNESAYIKETLSSVSQNRISNPNSPINGTYAPWSVVAWDKGVEVAALKNRFSPVHYVSLP